VALAHVSNHPQTLDPKRFLTGAGLTFQSPAPIEMGLSLAGIGYSAARGLKHHAWCPAPIEMGLSIAGIGGSVARGLKHHAYCLAPIEEVVKKSPVRAEQHSPGWSVAEPWGSVNNLAFKPWKGGTYVW